MQDQVIGCYNYFVMNQKVIMIILALMLFGLGYVVGQRSFNKASAVHHSILQQQPASIPPLSTLITYTKPKGWTKVINPNTSDLIELHSPDFKDTYSPFFHGAQIQLFNPGRPLKNSLTESALNMPLLESGTPMTLHFFQALHAIREFHCFEGCMEVYSFPWKQYVYDITFICDPGCQTEEQMDKSIYAKDRDTFLKSIVFHE